MKYNQKAYDAKERKDQEFMKASMRGKVSDMVCEELLKARKLPAVWENAETDWAKRREELKTIMQQEVYGFRPAEPEEITFTELPAEDFYGSFCAGKAPLKKIEIKVKISGKEFAFPMYAVVPVNGKKLPFFVHINFRPDVPDRYMPTEEIIDNGFAVFSFCYKDVTSDDADFNDGLAGLIFNGREREGSDCGKIALWSWAASRVMDYCQTLDCLDFNRSAVVGHSRLGKTALVTGMMDERFRFVFSNNSGAGGASLAHNKGEGHYEYVSESLRLVPYWYAPAYGKYGENTNEMPCDQHFLLACCAPRYVYVASAVEDIWADPNSEYLSCCGASEVYKRLGLAGFVHPDRLPEPADVLHAGSIGYHMRYGRHFFSREDWNYYMKFICSKN